VTERHLGRLVSPIWPIAAAVVCAPLLVLSAQPPPVGVRAIDPQGVALAPESNSARETKFSFVAYGDTRAAASDGTEGQIPQPGHSKIVDRILETIAEQRTAGFPVRFVVQSGDAVLDGRVQAQWNASFIPVVERLIHGGRVPFFFVVGNHDLDYGNRGQRSVGDPDRELGLRNTGAAMARLWPPEGSPRRLTGYPTFSFAHGQYFFLAIDSNIAFDDTQLEWVSRQLEALDRRRYPHVVAVFHHPVLTSGRHGGPKVEVQSDLMRRRYLPLFRKHHVRLTITGHDHFFDHWVEYFDDSVGMHRMDHIVSGGGGAPVYVYSGEQDLHVYADAAAPQKVRVEHLMRPGSIAAENPHHFFVADVDGDRMWIRVITATGEPFEPWGRSRIELEARSAAPAR
jgi:hypothetical protein